MTQLEQQSAAPGFWDNPGRAQEVMRRIAASQDLVGRFGRLEAELADAAELEQLFTPDDHASGEMAELVARIESDLQALEERGMFRSPEDARSAILSIHPGAGGTESCDWVEMLYRMYTHYIERQDLKYRVLDIQPNEEAGLKDVTVEVTGTNAYGLLKSEAGVHRLVRTSPFDANQRRHTTFAAVAVYPEVEDVEVEVNPNDLRVDTFRAGGHGGQNVNKVSSAVRITHLPTKIVVVCQNERSQLQNKQNAMKILRARLYDHLRREQDEHLRRIEEAKTDIAWGHQIRSYVLFPYRLVKDHRTDVETHDVDEVLSGGIEPFVHAFLTRPAEPAKQSALDTAANPAKKRTRRDDTGLTGKPKTEEVTMKLTVNAEECTGCELCVNTCPDLFELDGDVAKAKVDVVPEGAEECARTAAEDCPVSAIVVEE